MLKRRLSFAGIFSLAGKAVAVLTSLISYFLLARMLSPAGLGAYFIALSIVIYGSLLGALGLERVAVRYIAESLGFKEFDRARRVVSLVFRLGIVGSAAASLTYLCFGRVLGVTLFDSPELAGATALIAGWLAAMALLRLYIETFRGFQDFLLASLLDGGYSGVLLCSCLGLLWWLGIRSLSLANAISLTIISALAVIIFASWRLHNRVKRLPRETKGTQIEAEARGAQVTAREMVRVAWPLLITNIVLFATSEQAYPQLWILGAFRPAEEVAIYGAAMKLGLIVSMPWAISNSVVPPLIAEMYVQGEMGELTTVLRATTALAFIPALLASLALILLGGPILGLTFGSTYKVGAMVLALLSVGMLVIVWAGPCHMTLMMTGYQTRMMVIASASAALAIVGSIMVAGQYGAVGVALVASTSTVLQTILLWLTTRVSTGLWTHVSFRELLRLARKGW
jgi:O-antigen/teichoic acid export membrane protein